jgi:hypothetical protein
MLKEIEIMLCSILLEFYLNIDSNSEISFAFVQCAYI